MEIGNTQKQNKQCVLTLKNMQLKETIDHKRSAKGKRYPIIKCTAIAERGATCVLLISLACCDV